MANAYVTISDDNNINSEQTNTGSVSSSQTPYNQSEVQTLSFLSQQSQIQKQFVDILLNHSSPNQIISSCTSINHQHHYHKYHKLHHGIYTRYEQYYTHLRARCILELRKYIQLSNYPTVLKSAVDKDDDNDGGGDNDNGTMMAANQQLSLHTSELVHSIIKTLIQTNVWYQSVLNHIQHGQSLPMAKKEMNNAKSFIIQPIVIEFMKPIIQRVRYHFLPTASTTTEQGSQSTTSPIIEEIQKRPEKLLSWVCTYIKDLISESNMIHLWDTIQKIVVNVTVDYDFTSPPNVHTCFIAEMKQLIQFVLYKHEYMHHLKQIASSSSLHQLYRDSDNGNKNIANKMKNPMVLSQMIENCMKYDADIQQILKESNLKTSSSTPGFDSNNLIPTLTESIIVNDDKLFQWWLECERINSLNALRQHNGTIENDEESTVDPVSSGNTTASLLIMPFTDVFLSLLATFERKLQLIQQYKHKKAFMQKVEVPVCVAYMESMHEKASFLRSKLVPSSRIVSSSKVPSSQDLKMNLQKWFHVISGTKLAAQALLQQNSQKFIVVGDNNDDMRRNGKNDLDTERVRIGNSLHKLGGAMIDDLCSAFVEDLLLERTKFASYLMQCAYTVSSSHIDEYHSFHSNEISSELVEVYRLIKVLCEACLERGNLLNPLLGEGFTTGIMIDESKGENMDRTTRNGKVLTLRDIPEDIMTNIAQRIEEKFLEVALDYNEMIPDLHREGSLIFCFDTTQIVSLFLNEHQVYFNRLNNITNLMSMDDTKFVPFRSALRDLLVDPLDALVDDDDHDKRMISSSAVERLEQDGTLLNELQSMIFAQGFHSLGIHDAISIMNRRRVIDVESNDIYNNLQ